jgi:hypothetical protein
MGNGRGVVARGERSESPAQRRIGHGECRVEDPTHLEAAGALVQLSLQKDLGHRAGGSVPAPE